MITASHLPFNRNGFKFTTASATFDKKQITELLKRAAKVRPDPESFDDCR